MEQPKLNFDEYLGQNQTLPQDLKIMKFVTARSQEIVALSEAIDDPQRTGLVFQRIPKHMRRRIMSHNVKRLPRKLRSAYQSQLDKCGSVAERMKRPSRKYRRRPSNLLQEYNRRQKLFVWLETHIWHAKRFHMVQKWGYKIPNFPNDKCFRACYRATSSHCFIQDLSYYVCIELQGVEQDILEGLSHLTSPDCGLTFAAKYTLSGIREGKVTLFKSELYPLGMIGIVSFIWKPEVVGNERILWIWTHPAYYAEVLQELVKVFIMETEGNEAVMETDSNLLSTDKGRNVEMEKLQNRNVPISKAPKYISKKMNVKMLLLENTLNRFRLIGPLSQAVITEAFHIVDINKLKSIKNNKSEMSDHKEICDWVLDLFSSEKMLNCLKQQETFWKEMKNVSSPNQLPSNFVLPLTIEDPRLHMPKQKTKAVIDVDENETQSLLQVPETLSHGNVIWDCSWRDKSTINKLCAAELNLLRSKSLVPGLCDDESTTLDATEISYLPVMLLQRPGVQNSGRRRGYGCGWDVILPAGWGMPVWLSLVARGAQPGGLREANHIALEMDTESFLPPDSLAGKAEELARKEEELNKYFRLPPSKRPNFIKLGIVAPFHCTWSLLLQEMIRMRNRADEEEERWRAREQELLVRLEDSRAKERKLEDQKHNLEVCLADATQQIQELKARLGGAEGRVRALDSQLIQLENSKKEVEQKLSSVGSTLRRIAGIQLDGSVNIPFKLLSPSRRWSPVRVQEHHGDSARGDVMLDVDPDVIRKGVRTLMQQVAQIERERDDLKTQVVGFKKQLQESVEIQSKSDTKLSSALNNLRQCKEEKGSLEAKLGQKQAALVAQTEALQKKTEEAQQMREKVTTLELTLSSGSEEKSQFEDKLEKFRQSLGRTEAEKRSLQEELGRAETRATKLELQRLGLEGDMQRLQIAMQEKDANIKKLQERCDSQVRNISSLEERCVSLKSTIDQLNSSLERSSVTESELRTEIQSLQRTLLDTSQTSQSSSEKLKQLQKSLSNSENERRVLTERFDSMQQTLSELRRAYQQLQDQNSRMQTELANNEVQRAGLESQLRLANWPGESSGNEGRDGEMQRVQRERSELKSKIEALQDKVRHLENEKRSLERKIQTGRSKSYERPEKASVECGYSGGYSNNMLEQENRDLKSKIRRLEGQLAEKESEIALLKASEHSRSTLDRSSDIERYRAGQLQAEKLLEAREISYRQQIHRLENQIQHLKDQLLHEAKRRQLYVSRSSRAGREMQELRQVLGDSLRTVSQDPSLDAMLLEHEARKLDTSVTPLALPPPRPHTPHN